MANDADDFEVWYRQVHPRLGASLAYSFGDVALAQQTTDEAFALALESWGNVSAMKSPVGWLYKVAFHQARQRLRRPGIVSRILGPRRCEPVARPVGELWAVVADLPYRQRQAVVLRHVGQLPKVDVGAAMGIDADAVSSTLGSAYRSLQFTSDGPPPLLEID